MAITGSDMFEEGLFSLTGPGDFFLETTSSSSSLASHSTSLEDSLAEMFVGEADLLAGNLESADCLFEGDVDLLAGNLESAD